MKLRTLMCSCLLLVMLLGSVRCRNDQEIIDKHEQTLLEEDD